MSPIRVTAWKEIESGAMRGLLDCEFDIDLAGVPATVQFKSCKLMSGQQGEWIGLPSSMKYVGGSKSYENLIYFAERSQNERFSELVIEALCEFRQGGR